MKKKLNLNKIIFIILFFIFCFICFFINIFKSKEIVSKIELSPVVEKYLNNRKSVKIPADIFLKDFFPNMNLLSYDVICSARVLPDGFVSGAEHISLKLKYSKIKNFSIDFSDNNLLYPPYYIFISDRYKTNIKNVALDYYNGMIDFYNSTDSRFINYVNAESGIRKRNSNEFTDCSKIKNTFLYVARNKNEIYFYMINE